MSPQLEKAIPFLVTNKLITTPNAQIFMSAIFVKSAFLSREKMFSVEFSR